MPQKRYEWEPGDPPPLIEAHSLAKHEVLRQYLVTYVDVLTANPTVDHFRLTLVDGFAGGGRYVDHNGTMRDGSPLLMLAAMEEARVAAQLRRTKPFQLDVAYVFIEERARVVTYLTGLLEERGYRTNHSDGKLRVLRGEFATHADGVVAAIRARGRAGRSIFLLDQYGYSDVPLPLLRRIFHNLPHAEILLTFATDWLVDYMRDAPAFHRTLRNAGLTSVSDQLTALLEAKDSPDWRRLAQAVLYEELWHGSGAKFFTPFFIVSESASRDYWLVHLSNHARARDEMTKLHWALENRFQHYGRHGLCMLGYRASDDPAVSGQGTFRFDTDAMTSTRAALAEEIPRRLAARPDGLSFGAFFQEVCNETPASSPILADVVKDLGECGELEVVGPNGKERRRGVQVASADVIRVPRQLRFDLARGGKP